MGLRGPKPGHGGRPRIGANQKPNAGGYVRNTSGPKGAGTLVYNHRSIASGQKPGGTALPPKGDKASKPVVNHANHKRSDNRPSNLQRMSKAKNNRV